MERYIDMKRFVVVSVLLASGGIALGGGLAGQMKDLPAEARPETVAKRVIDQFLSSNPIDYRPKGYAGNNGYGWRRMVVYSVVSLWANAIECAGIMGDDERKGRLIRKFDPFLPQRALNWAISQPNHVDDAVFGALPYELYLVTKDPVFLEMGNFYADTQWAPPNYRTFTERDNAPRADQLAYVARGLSPQTRLWIDDMYMMGFLQSQAYRATGDRKYVDRVAAEMCYYLDKLQIKDGGAKGLFYHAPDVPYVWGRGDGWMAAAMPLILDRLPEDNPDRGRISEGYRLMMSALLRFQREDGMWCQLVDRPDDGRNWGETSATAMFAYAFAVGVRRGWLPAEAYGNAVRRAWLALCAHLDEHANLSDVCAGTGKKNDLQYYFDRPRVNGDPHGQAPMLWLAIELLR